VLSHQPANEANDADLLAEWTAKIAAPQTLKSLAKAPLLAASGITQSELRERTHVQLSSGQSSCETRIELWHVAGSEEQALFVTQQLAEHCAHAHSRQSANRQKCAECDAAQSAVHQAAAELRSAKSAVETFREQHAAALAAPVVAPAASETPNPAWQVAADRIDVLSAARAKLLEQRTPAHPEVLDIEAQIEAARHALANTPRTLSVTAEAAHPSHAKISDVPRDTRDELARKLKTLTAAYDLAARRHNDALAAERKAWQERWSQPAEQITIVEPARIVARRGGGPSRAGVVVMGLVAIAVAGAVAWRSQIVELPTTLASAAQVQQLGLAVAGVLSTRDGPAIPQPRRSNPGWASFLTFGCELSLAAMMALVAVAVLSDWQIAAQAIRDPLTAFSDAVARILP
jgi:hypothetical protein